MRLRSHYALVALLVAACATSPQPQKPPQQVEAPKPGNRLTPVAQTSRSIAAPVVRVGLLSDQRTIAFDRIDGGYFVVADNGPSVIRRGFTVSAPLSDSPVTYAVQVAAVSDKESAQSLADRIATETGQRADLSFDAGPSLYRVLVGVFPDENAARPLREQLTTRGYAKDMMIVKRPGDQPFQKTLKLVDDEGDSYTINSASLLVLPVTAETVRIGEKRYRGGARVFINSRGLINEINELNMEDYVRGVVPNEMGPKFFDEVEGLKAQALAARTYVVNRLGDFATEGFDICPTPACQVYEGFSTEDALSDQAVRETAGMIITYQGKPIDALYTSTCGGETSDVNVMFPTRSEPYLKRARCVELDLTTIDGRADGPLLTEMQGEAHLFAAIAGLPDTAKSWGARDVVDAVNAASRIAGMSLANAPAPASSRRGDVLTYLAAAWNLAPVGRVLTLPEDRTYFFPTAGNDSPAYLAAAFLIKYGIAPAQSLDKVDMSAAMPREELYALLFSWLREYEALRETTGKVLAIDGRTISFKAAGKSWKFTLPAGIPTYRKFQQRVQEYRAVPVMIGDRASVFQGRTDAPFALVVQANYDGAAFDRTSSFSNWTRSFRADDLVKSIAKRNAIQQLADLQPVRVDESNRIVELNVIAENGRVITLKGLPIRWSLGVPDNLFRIVKSKDADGMDRYTFFGKGWGHGTGMCQVGAYGMAFRGWKADQIIKHYFTEVEIVKWNLGSGSGAQGSGGS